MSINISIIEWLLENRPHDLLRILEADPRYVRADLSNYPRNREHNVIYQMALEHVRFIDRFGKVKFANIGDKVYSEQSEYFKQWLTIGCVGIDEASIQHYLKLKPIESNR